MVLVADGTKVPKEGGRIPAVKSLHQGIPQQLKATLYRGALVSGYCFTGSGASLALLRRAPSLTDQREKPVPRGVQTL